jgi:hypothetical protein
LAGRRGQSDGRGDQGHPGESRHDERLIGKAFPTNGKPFPEGSKIAKIEWQPRKITSAPFSATGPDTVPGTLTQVELIEKDGKRFPDAHGWGYAVFKYDAASDTFTPDGKGAACGVTCHKLAAAKDYIFTDYPKR